MSEEYLLLEKEVDISVLRDGMAIPTVYQELFYKKMGVNLKRGETVDITINLQGKDYIAQLKNLGIQDSLHPNHGDLLQIRYSRKSELAIMMRKIFSNSWNYLQQERNERLNSLPEGARPPKMYIQIPKEKKEYVAVYTTPIKGCLAFDCITNSEYVREQQIITQTNEIMYELQVMQNDDNAGITISNTPHKVRRMTKAVGESLKALYDYRCQVCGEKIGAKYGSLLIHAHHIDYFTRSMNNNAENIMIVCPNHHGIIHDRNPEYDSKNKAFLYPNGLVEGLKVNLHL